MKNMSKAARERLMKSDFWNRTCEIIVAWDYYLTTNDRESSDECMHEFNMAKLALEHITGELYGFTRNGETSTKENPMQDYHDDITRLADKLQQVLLEEAATINDMREAFKTLQHRANEMHFQPRACARCNQNLYDLADNTDSE